LQSAFLSRSCAISFVTFPQKEKIKYENNKPHIVFPTLLLWEAQ